MLSVRELTKDYTGLPVLDHISFSLPDGSKTGVIGKNGAGKTTLLRVLTGADDDWSGKVSFDRPAEGGSRSRIGYVPQHFPPFAGTSFEYLLEPVFAERTRLAELEEEMALSDSGVPAVAGAPAESGDLAEAGAPGAATALSKTDGPVRGRRKLEAVLAEWGELRAAYDAADGDGAEDRALRELASLDLSRVADSPVDSLSGGEKTVLSLSRAMLGRPELLVLDEPGNHLDLWGLAWLEATVREYPGTVLVVSHNRYLLDRTVERIVELEGAKAREFTGNYSQWRVDRLRRAVSGEMAWRADSKKIERLEALVKRFREIARVTADPAWGKRLHSRVTQLEKTKERAAERAAECPVVPGKTASRSPSFAFSAEASRARLALRVEGLTLGFPGRTLLDDVSLVVETGERVALVGPNGSGKTTFIRAVLAAREAEAGSEQVWIGPSMKVGWCSQHGEALDPEKTVLDSCVEAGALNADAAWKWISRLGFARDALGQKTGELSGGERVRLQLALADIAGANFLVLDEPTNHLDIVSCEAIEDALAEFAGTILLVSHDRLLLDRVATRIVEISECRFNEYEGNFTEFWFSKYGDSARRLSATSANLRDIRSAGDWAKPGSGSDASTRAAYSRGAGASGSGLSAVGRETSVEERIIALEGERSALEKETERLRMNGDLAGSRSAGNRLDALMKRIEKLYEEWK